MYITKQHWAGVTIFILSGMFTTKVVKNALLALSCLPVHLHVPTQEPLNRFSLNVMLGSFNKIS
jgi:hypothetical protein